MSSHKEYTKQETVVENLLCSMLRNPNMTAHLSAALTEEDPAERQERVAEECEWLVVAASTMADAITEQHGEKPVAAKIKEPGHNAMAVTDVRQHVQPGGGQTA